MQLIDISKASFVLWLELRKIIRGVEREND